MFVVSPPPSPSPISPQPSSPPADDELDDLPALDGGAEGDEEREANDEENAVDESPPDAAGNPFEDETGEDDPIDDEELDTANDAAGWIEEEQDAEALDLGASELSLFEGERVDRDDDVEEQGVGNEDFGLVAGSEKSDLDAGEEGPLAEDAPLRDEDLPALDADADGEMDEADLVDPGFASEESAALLWAERPWKTVGAPLDLGPVRAIACAGRGVVASTATGLVRVDLEGAREPVASVGLEGVASRLAAEGATLVAVTDVGALFVSSDGGATFRRAAACRGARGVRDVVLEHGVMWALTSDGAVARSRDLGTSWETLGVSGVKAIAPDAKSGVLLVTALGVLRGTDPFASMPAPPHPSVGLVEGRADHVAYAPGAGGVSAAVFGQAWTRADGVGRVTAMTFLDDVGTLLVAMHRDADDVTWLVRAKANALPEVVAEVGESPGRTQPERQDKHGTRDKEERDEDDLDGAAIAMARDDAHDVIWVAGWFGLFAYEPS